MPRSHYRRVRVALVCSMVIAVSCSDPTSTPTAGTNTNWLVACEADAECDSALSCHCGACSKACTGDADCSVYSGTSCVAVSERAAEALCAGSAKPSAGLCLPSCEPGECASSQSCVLGACVPAPIPDSVFCSTVTEADEAARTLQDALIASVERTRINGGGECGSGSTTVSLPPLRLDSRLICAARVLASEMAATQVRSLKDASGRDTVDRLALAGYSSRTWAEGYAWDVPDVDTALAVMLRDPDFCAGFSDATLTDLGVAHAGTTYVVTLAAR